VRESSPSRSISPSQRTRHRLPGGRPAPLRSVPRARGPSSLGRLAPGGSFVRAPIGRKNRLGIRFGGQGKRLRVTISSGVNTSSSGARGGTSRLSLRVRCAPLVPSVGLPWSNIFFHSAATAGDDCVFWPPTSRRFLRVLSRRPAPGPPGPIREPSAPSSGSSMLTSAERKLPR